MENMDSQELYLIDAIFHATVRSILNIYGEGGNISFNDILKAVGFAEKINYEKTIKLYDEKCKDENDKKLLKQRALYEHNNFQFKLKAVIK